VSDTAASFSLIANSSAEEACEKDCATALVTAHTAIVNSLCVKLGDTNNVSSRRHSARALPESNNCALPSLRNSKLEPNKLSSTVICELLKSLPMKCWIDSNTVGEKSTSVFRDLLRHAP